MASASAAGSLHVWRVEHTCRGGAPDRYTGVTARRQVPWNSPQALDPTGLAHSRRPALLQGLFLANEYLWPWVMVYNKDREDTNKSRKIKNKDTNEEVQNEEETR